jgi:hypothetical protein
VTLAPVPFWAANAPREAHQNRSIGPSGRSCDGPGDLPDPQPADTA